MTTELTKYERHVPTTHILNQEQRELLKKTLLDEATDSELDLFITQCNRVGLDPFSGQIVASKIQGRMQIQVTIDGRRLIAERTGKYAGQTEPQWCGADGVWRDVWLSSDPPAAARVGVYRKDFRSPVWGIVRYSAYVNLKKDGTPNIFWTKMPDVMLAKCAESLAMRKAFPVEMFGYRREVEADNEIVAIPHDDMRPEVRALFQICTQCGLEGHRELRLGFASFACNRDLDSFKMLTSEEVSKLHKILSVVYDELGGDPNTCRDAIQFIVRRGEDFVRPSDLRRILSDFVQLLKDSSADISSIVEGAIDAGGAEWSDELFDD